MSVTVMKQPTMERDWTERTFFSAEPDWLKEAMRCDAISPVEGSDPQEWEVGYLATGNRIVARPYDEVAIMENGNFAVIDGGIA